MELIVLGSSAAWPDAGGAAAGYLLRHDGFNLWIDAGTGTLANLQLHGRHEDLGALVITHEHIDHCIDLYPLFMARLFHPEPLEPLPLYAPKGVFDRVAKLEDQEGIAEMHRLFELHEVDAGEPFEAGPFRFDSRLLPHWVPNLGFRIEAGGRTLVYTGDTGPSDDISALGRDADLLVTEASWQDADRERPPYHLTARQAGEHAARAGAGRLLLTHFWPGIDRDVSRAQASEAFGGEVVPAREGLSLEVEAS